ncbi:hypothetical protein ACS0PU_008592 [Formica fusca]
MAPHRCIPACSREPRGVQLRSYSVALSVYAVVVVAVNAKLGECTLITIRIREWTTQNRTRIMNFTDHRHFYPKETARIIGELSAPLFQPSLPLFQSFEWLIKSR